MKSGRSGHPKGFLRLLAALVLGVLFGAGVMTVHMARQIEELMYRIRVLDEELAASRLEADELRASLSSERRQVVTGVRVDISFADELTIYEEQDARLEIEKKVKEWLQPLYGAELDSVNPEMIPRIVDGRDVQVETKKFRVTTRIVYIGGEVLVCLEAAIDRPPEFKPRELTGPVR